MALIDMRQAARRLGVTEFGVRRWAREGRIPVVRLGKLVRLRQEDVERIAEHGLPPSPSVRTRRSGSSRAQRKRTWSQVSKAEIARIQAARAERGAKK